MKTARSRMQALWTRLRSSGDSGSAAGSVHPAGAVAGPYPSDWAQVSHIHQVLIVDGFGMPPLPPGVSANALAARAVYPDAAYRMWNGEELRNFISSAFGQDVLWAFDTLRPYSYKCDLARFCLLHHFGGLYIDLGVRLLRRWPLPQNFSVAAFSDVAFLTENWATMQTGLLWARPRQREFELAIGYIVENCRTRYYGRGPLHPTGPVLLGKAMIAAHVERGPAAPGMQRIGECKPITPDQSVNNLAYISVEQVAVGLRTKLIAGDIGHLGITQGNNYNQLWHSRRAFGEREQRWLADTLKPVALPASNTTSSANSIEIAAGTIALAAGSYEALFSFSAKANAARLDFELQSETGVKLLSRAIEAPFPGNSQQPILAFEMLDDDKVTWRLRASPDFRGSLDAVTIRDAAIRCWSHDDPAIKVPLMERAEEGIRVAPGTKGLVSYGPYSSLQRGDYRLKVVFGAIDTRRSQLTVDITADFGKRPLAGLTIRNTKRPGPWDAELLFHCVTDAQAVEFKVRTKGGVHAELRGFSLERL